MREKDQEIEETNCQGGIGRQRQGRRGLDEFLHGLLYCAKCYDFVLFYFYWYFFWDKLIWVLIFEKFVGLFGLMIKSSY